MSTELREYQIITIKQLFSLIRSGCKRVLVVLSCGAGKSTIFSKVFRMTYDANRKALFVVHRRGLVKQFSDRMKNQFGLDCGVIMSGFEYKQNNINVASIQTLSNRQFPEADIIIFDESHNIKANIYKPILEYYKDKIIVGMTATPERLDGSPLGDVFEKYINPIKMTKLIDLGFLVGTKTYEPEAVMDLSDVKTSMGEFNEKQLFVKYNHEGVYVDFVNFWKLKANGLKTLFYCINVEHSKKMCDAFNKNGIKSRHIDGATSDEDRDEITKQLVCGKITCVMNCQVYIEGTDIPCVEACVLAVATKSKTRYVQMVGRAQRTSEGKTEAIILDFGGNTTRHGFVEDYDLGDFSLTGKKKKAIEKPLRKCPKCLSIISYTKKDCPCGYVFKARQEKELTPQSRFGMSEISRQDALISQIRKQPYSKLKNAAIGKLLLIEKVRGFKVGWAVIRLKEIDTRFGICNFNQCMEYLKSEEIKIGYDVFRNGTQPLEKVVVETKSWFRKGNKK